MDISEKKRQIVERINNIQEEWLIKAIEKLLDIDIDDDNETPDWHISLLQERLEHYQKNPSDVVKWEEIKKRWKDEL